MSDRRGQRSWLAVVFALAFAVAMSRHTPAGAHPDDPDDPPAAAEQTEQAKATDREARELYLEGEADYAAGRYEDAAAKFARAYQLSKRPALLFNMANAYERMGDYESALLYLERYLEGPKVEDVVSVRERIKRLRATVAANRAKPADNSSEPVRHHDRPRAPTIDLSDTRAPVLDPSDTRPPARWPAYLFFGAGGAAMAGGVLFGLASRDAAGDAAAHCARQDGSWLCSSRARDALDRERRYAMFADLSTVAAVAAAGVGLYFTLRSSARTQPAEPARTSMTPWIMPGGLGLGVSGAL